MLCFLTEAATGVETYLRPLVHVNENGVAYHQTIRSNRYHCQTLSAILQWHYVNLYILHRVFRVLLVGN